MTAPPSSPVGDGPRAVVEEFATATSAELARLVRAERVMIRTRWGGVAFALVQVLTYYLPYPPGLLELALGLTALIAVGNVVIWRVLPHATTLSRARLLSVAALALNGVLFTGLVFVYTFDTETAIFALLYVLPMEAAIRFQLRGALWTILLVTVAYTVREAVGTLVYGHPFLVVSISFRMGIGLIIAAIAGGIAQTLIRDREQLAALNAITRELASATSPQDVLDSAARRIGALLRAPAVAIAVADGGTLQVRAVSVAPGATAGRAVGEPIPIEGPVRDAFDAGRARLVADPAAPPRRRRWRRSAPGDGLVLAPLLARGEAVGLVLAGTGGRSRRFSSAELALVETVAGQLAGALVNAGLFVEARAARDAADRANEAKGAFLANMSHEIRTPMNAVIGSTELLRSTPMTREQTELVDIARSSGENLLRIIDDVLDFSKVEADRLELERIPMDLRDCVEGALDVLAQRAAAKGVDLVGAIDPYLPAQVTGDPVRLRQVLVNLVGNAVKFTSHGEVVATVSRGSGDAVRVEVADTGPGIPSERLDRLFRSFSQVDVSTTRRHGGTGLGLAISQRIVGLMGGRIEVRSTVGQGTVFAFEVVLPAVADAPAQDTPATVRGRRILLADTAGARRRAIAAQCAAWGADVRETDLDDACSRLVGGERFDVVIVRDPGGDSGSDGDVGSGRGSGCGSLVDAAAGTPVIVLSPVGTAGPERAVASVIQVSLPVKHAALAAALDRALGAGPRPTEPLSSSPEPLPPLRILLAEDHPVNRTLALRLLATLDLHADVAETGLEVLAALTDRDYDVVLMDVQMPELDGLETARRIVAERGADRPWLVAVTANAMAGDREMCLAAGMDDYLAKPIRRDGLVEALRRVPVRTVPTPAPDPTPAARDHSPPDRGRADSAPCSLGPTDPGPADPGPTYQGPTYQGPTDQGPADWDPSVLRELADSFGPDGDGVVAELVDAAADEVPGTAARLRAAHLAGDDAAVRREAHALKSTAATLGAPALARRCRDVETGTADPAELAGRVERDAADLVTRLRAVTARA